MRTAVNSVQTLQANTVSRASKAMAVATFDECERYCRINETSDEIAFKCVKEGEVILCCGSVGIKRLSSAAKGVKRHQ